jgi:hypothetical protein
MPQTPPLKEGIMSRIEERKNLISRGLLLSEPPFKTYPACSRYDDAQDDNGYRCAFVYFYALGRLGKKGRSEFEPSSIVRLHNHKGELFVVYRKELPTAMRRALCGAWEYVTRDKSTDVEFVHYESAEWRDVWSRRTKK